MLWPFGSKEQRADSVAIETRGILKNDEREEIPAHLVSY